MRAVARAAARTVESGLEAERRRRCMGAKAAVARGEVRRRW